ncbi:sigma-54-dependent Fis family transcriptional regulator [Niastella yeongjuensis]|uniref:Sigma-54-dependent Fis family transcriptional regulator n=1 Tax=Niastella yeongjuensis TaxID=354355 RepID=A0A1V9ELD4_9BACT|nr:sigma-54 dependent transcriptional regulator [Niastella yeongjuensis]OQP46949.1 sigma-54-dependent Fis family transcriptional regulator [Niastella yeongjuensis]SEN62061.1 two-component system, NtrC family, response regulator HydG [Niastella yeongjuensis]
MPKILVIDDDRDICLLLKRFLTKHNYEVAEVYAGKKALELMNSFTPDLVLCDFRLDDMDGTTLLVKIKEQLPDVPVIIMTGYSDIKVAVEVMKLGAYDYIGKPLFPDEILVTIKKALQPQPAATAQATNTTVEAAPVYTAPATVTEGDGLADRDKKQLVVVSGDYIFGDSEPFKKILKQIDLVAPTNYSIIIYGESGSGKEAIAQEIHKRSRRKSMPFVAIDCGAMSKELAGSELFGHEKGSFTGALNQKIGNLEIANGGTVFLDEIGNLSYDIQVSLLRVVQERKMRRVGGTKDIDLDIRIIVASNEKLWDIARKGKFREDLYHRFNEFSIVVPPLRERKEDIMVFARHFLLQTNKELEKNVKGFTKEVEDIFKSYIWYGNLRELKNVIKRATLLAEGTFVEAHTLPFEISNFTRLQFDEAPDTSFTIQAEPKQAISTPPIPSPISEAEIPRPHPHHSHSELSLKNASIDAEYETIIEALKKSNFNKSKAAKLLNIDRKTLYNKMKQYQEFNNQ